MECSHDWHTISTTDAHFAKWNNPPEGFYFTGMLAVCKCCGKVRPINKRRWQR